MRRSWIGILAAAAVAAWALLGGVARADVRLPALFTDGMVLQQGMPVPVWGWADDGERVTVRFHGQEVSAVAHGGKWQVRLAPMRAGGPWPLTVVGKNTIELPHAFVGEVWIASGQSNMQWNLLNSYEGEKEVAASANPMLRLFTVPNVKASAPLDDVKSQWVESGPETTPSFSAVAYYFGRDLQRALKVPVGIIHTSWGGSPAEVWMSRRVLERDPEYRELCSAASRSVAQWLERYTQAQLNREALQAQNAAQIAEARRKGQELVAAA
ncbi:MAG: sialate O-acetylesterase, partial [Armatimonadota bacterium]|nr:sialate O-acetylesterase [Armatimonadota bacterium]